MLNRSVRCVNKRLSVFTFQDIYCIYKYIAYINIFHIHIYSIYSLVSINVLTVFALHVEKIFSDILYFTSQWSQSIQVHKEFYFHTLCPKQTIKLSRKRKLQQPKTTKSQLVFTFHVFKRSFFHLLPPFCIDFWCDQKLISMWIDHLIISCILNWLLTHFMDSWLTHVRVKFNGCTVEMSASP